MDSWVTLDSWVIPCSIIEFAIQNMMKKYVILQYSRLKWKFYNIVHAPNASYMSVHLAIRWICG